MKMNVTSIATIHEVQKTFGPVGALEQASFSVKEGECLALVGHNGAGKSTLIKILLGLIRPTSGNVNVLGADPATKEFDRIKRQIGFLPEQILFQKNLTGREILSFYARLKGQAPKSVDPLFDRVNLRQAADRRVGTYSKGMRQRLGIAQSLIGNPKLLILDEPTSGLDPAARQNIYRILSEEKQKGTTILISSHVLTELDERIDRVVMLNRGCVVANGSIADLRNRQKLPSTIYIEASLENCDRIQGIFQHELKTHRPSRSEVVLYCEADRKVRIINSLMVLGIKMTDIRVTDPSLEEVFNAYMRRSAEGGDHA